MSTYLELQEQIKFLTEQAEEARKNELKAVIDDINKKIEAYKIKSTDLVFTNDIKSNHTEIDSGKKKLPAVYRNPDNSNQIWSGRGRTPDWYSKALETYTEDQLKIENQS